VIQRSINEPVNGAKALLDLTLTLMKASLVFTVGIVSIVASMPLINRFFTSDMSVISQVNSVVPILAIWMSMQPLVFLSEGVLLGRKDLGFLGKSYGMYFFALPYAFLRLKEASLSGIKTATLASVWHVFLIYQVSRFFLWTYRLIQQTRRSMNEAESKQEQLIFG